MSVATPTVIPRTPLFPTLLPKPPQPHPLPLPRHGQRPARLNAIRDLNKEMDDLSDEDEQLEDQVRKVSALYQLLRLTVVPVACW